MQNQEGSLQTVKIDNPVRKKRLGQFFTGYQLAKLLVVLANSKKIASVIDPMCGTGDMLKAAADINPNLEFSGIDIDGSVLKDAEVRLKSFPHVCLIEGNAFNLHNLKRLYGTNFDLVITNPPYVRYQSFSSADNIIAPNATQIRNELLKDVDFLLGDSEERYLFHEIVKSYSGLSDLAVPSWILAAMLTKIGGTLALVVPESWLSRDYAQIIQYMLHKCFKIRYIIEDSNASWFPDALVKTTLLVADRINYKQSAFMWQNDDYYAHVRIYAEACNSQSIVGNIFPNESLPEKRFADELASVVSMKRSRSTEMWSINLVRLSDISNNLKNIIGSESWLSKCEPLGIEKPNGINLPIELKNWLQGRQGLESFQESGISVGQGLRTGANSFFYVDIVKQNSEYAFVEPNAKFNIGAVKIPLKNIQPVLRKQSELPEGYDVKKSALRGRVLLLQSKNTSDGLVKFIETASKTKIGDTLIPELSAVKTNIRKIDKRKELTGWYILPTLAPRHLPLLFIPRVNGDIPRTYLNSPGVIIDANFSTIWLNSNSQFTEYSLLALLNSSWTVAAMELSGSVMGGGALKIEATHIKRIPIPHLKKEQLEELHHLGAELIRSDSIPILKHIDEVVVGTFFDKENIQRKIKELKAIIETRFKERTKRK